MWSSRREVLDRFLVGTPGMSWQSALKECEWGVHETVVVRREMNAPHDLWRVCEEAECFVKK